jgi:hypothetical protein
VDPRVPAGAEDLVQFVHNDPQFVSRRALNDDWIPRCTRISLAGRYLTREAIEEPYYAGGSPSERIGGPVPV